MKNRNYKMKSFTMIECIFAIFILSIISIYIISGINNFLHIQKENAKNINKLTDLENTVVIIKNNIKINYIEDMEKIYEIYISK